MTKLLLIAGFALMFALGFAFPPDLVALGVLMFLLGFNAHYVFALAFRHRNRTRAPRRGSLVYLRPHAPQAVRKERRA